MFTVQTDQVEQVLTVRLSNHVTVQEAKACVDELQKQLTGIPPGCRVLTDLTYLEWMDVACEPFIARMMDLFSDRGVTTVVRIIPDPQKDIGFNILSLFHYRPNIPVVTCERFEDAITQLVMPPEAAALKVTRVRPQFTPIKDFEPVMSILSQISIFGGVSAIHLDRVLNRLESGLFRKGEFIFQKGDEPTHIYIVKGGKIDLWITDSDVDVQKHHLGIGECFGEASLLSMHRHTATAVATEDAEIIVLSRHALITLKKDDIQLFALIIMNIARNLARRLHSTNDILLHYVHTHEKSGNT